MLKELIAEKIRLDSAKVELATEKIKNATIQHMDSLYNSLTGLGGSNDKGASAKPNTGLLPLTELELRYLYRNNGYAKKIVDLPAEYATSKGWIVKDESDEYDPMQDEDRRLRIKSRVRQACINAGIDGGGFIFIAAEEAGIQDLSQPLLPQNIIRILNLVVLDAQEVSGNIIDTNINSPNFRMPKYWNISPQSGGVTSGIRPGQPVHWTRMLYFPGDILPPSEKRTLRRNDIDSSALQVVWDQVRNKSSVDQGAAILAQDFRLTLMRIGDLQARSASEQAANFNARMRLIAKGQSLLNMVLVSQDETMEVQSQSVSGFRDLDEQSRYGLQSVTRIPATLMFGEAPRGLNTDGDSSWRLWKNEVHFFQDEKIRDPLSRYYRFIYAQKAGPFAGNIPKSWTIEFNTLDEPTPSEESTIRKTNAETDNIYLQMGVITEENIIVGRFGNSPGFGAIQPIDPNEVATGLPLPTQEQVAEQEVVDSTPEGLIQARALAAQMTEHGVERCSHGRPNRCPICGIAREFKLVIGPDGKPETDAEGKKIWGIAWRAIGDKQKEELTPEV